MRIGYTSYFLMAFFGLLISLLVVLKLIKGWNIDSDWFWFLAGLGLAVEGLMVFKRQRRFGRKQEALNDNFKN